MCQFPSVYFVLYDLPSFYYPSFPLSLLASLSISLAFLSTYIGSMNADIIHVLSSKVQISVQVDFRKEVNTKLC